MREQPFFFGNEDLLKLIIKECLTEVLLEFHGKVPYPPARFSAIDKKILTRKQAAEYLQVTPNTLTRYVKQGKLLPAIINGKYRFFESDLIKLLNGKKA